MKQSTRIKVLTVLFIVTGIAASFVLYRTSSFYAGTNSFPAIAVDSASIAQVELLCEKKNTSLKKDLGYWKVNSTYQARPSLIQLMIVGLTKMEIKRTVAQENKQKVVAHLKEKGIVVTVKGNELDKTFYIAPNENDVNSSYYIEKNSQEPYIVFVPGFRNNIANLLKMDEAVWRSRVIFSSGPKSLQKISVEYPSLPTNNLTLVWNSDNTFEISGVKKIDSSKVFTYLSQFEQVSVDGYIYENKDKILEELTKTSPKATIEVKDLAPNGSHKVAVYGESKEPKGIYAVVTPENDLVVFKPETLFRLLVRKEFFEKKNNSTNETNQNPAK